MSEPVVALRSLLNSTVNFVSQLENRFPDPAPGSPAATDEAANTEFAGPWDPVPLTTCQSGPDLAALNTLDALLGLARLLQGDTVLWFADQPLVRVVLEASARAWWWYDPTVDSRERLQRGWTERLHALHEEAKFRRNMKIDPTGHTSRILDGCRALNLPLHTPPKKAPYVGRARHDTTLLVRMMLSNEGDTFPLGEVLYRMSSAMTHSVSTGLMLRLEAGERIGPHVRKAEPRPRSVAELWTDHGAALLAFQRMETRRLTYFGWAGPEWATWCKTIRDKVTHYTR